MMVARAPASLISVSLMFLSTTRLRKGGEKSGRVAEQKCTT